LLERSRIFDMRIIYVTACLPFGAAEAFIIDELNELLGKHEVLIVPRSPGKPGPHGASLLAFTRRETLLSPRVLGSAVGCFVRMPRRVLNSARCVLRTHSLIIALRNLAVLPKALWLAEVATEWKADHIHCHWAGTTATMALIASRVSGVPWSLTAHRSDIVGNNLLSEKANSACKVRVISLDGKRMMLERGVEANSKLQVLPMGVAIPPQSAFNRSKVNVVLCPADLLEVKGHRYLLHAWRIVKDRGIRGELWLAGEGELRNTLTKLVENLELASSVRFLGTVAHASLLELYSNGMISAVALASVDLGGGCHEGIPVALVEAMSYGIPVIGTDTGGTPELIKPGTGVLVRACDAVALADAIQMVLADDRLSEQIGQRARRHIIETRNVASVAATLGAWFSGHYDASVPELGDKPEARVHF
jgi:colanic acid/amylovoran biosynthesis glycosyltransferase